MSHNGRCSSQLAPLNILIGGLDCRVTLEADCKALQTLQDSIQSGFVLFHFGSKNKHKHIKQMRDPGFHRISSLPGGQSSFRQSRFPGAGQSGGQSDVAQREGQSGGGGGEDEVDGGRWARRRREVSCPREPKAIGFPLA